MTLPAPDIFGNTAPYYFEKGISVVPLWPYNHPFPLDEKGNKDHRCGKAPCLEVWQMWAHQFPDEQTRQYWINRYRHFNIGLVTGPSSNICGIDVDTRDEKVAKIIDDCLPQQRPWKRVGQKGCMYAFKFNPRINNGRKFQIKDEFGGMILEFIGIGSQFVLPPSIHPGTEREYTANVNLLEVIDQLVDLPDDLEDRLISALERNGVRLKPKTKFSSAAWVSSGSRDTSMTLFAGRLAYEVMRGDITLKRALNNMQDWADRQVEQVAGDEVSFKKGQNSIIKFLLSDIERKHKLLPLGWNEGLTPEELEQLGLSFTADDEKWPAEKIMTELRNHFSENGTNPVENFALCRKLMDKMAKSDLSNMDVDRILSLMKTLTKSAGENISIASFKAQYKELLSGGTTGKNHTEIAQKLIEETEHRYGELRQQGGRTFTWGGSNWVALEERDLLKILAEEFGELEAAKRNSDHTGILKVATRLVPGKLSVDGGSKGINFANGFLDEKLELHPHHKDHGMIYTMPYRYMPDLAGKCPKFFGMLETYWGLDVDYHDKVQALREMMAATLFGVAPSFQKAFLMKGVAQSGKSQILEIVSWLVPQEGKVALPPRQWKERHMLINLMGKVLNISGELGRDDRISGESFKKIIGGEEVSDRDLYAGLISFRAVAAHWFASNYLPSSDDATDGFLRRWLILNFTRQIPPEKRVLDYGRIVFEEEAEAIVAWVAECYQELQARGNYTLPASHKKEVGMMAALLSSVRAWFNARVMIRAGEEVTVVEAYRGYKSFSLQLSAYARPVGELRFVQEVLDYANESRKETGVDVMHIEKDTQGGKVGYFVGLKVLS